MVHPCSALRAFVILPAAVSLAVACGRDDGEVSAGESVGGASRGGDGGAVAGRQGQPPRGGAPAGNGGQGLAGKAPGSGGARPGGAGSTGPGGSAGASATGGKASSDAGAAGESGKGGKDAAAGKGGAPAKGGSGGGGGSGAGTGGSGKSGSSGKGGSGGATGPLEPCTTKVTYGSRWIHPDGTSTFDLAQGNVTWDGACHHDGANSYALLSNGWKPYFEGHGCTLGFERESCDGAPAACRTRVGYGPAWEAPPNHPNRYDDVAGVVAWSGECRNGGNDSSGLLSNGWSPTFSAKNSCELSFSYEACGGLFANPVIGGDCPDPGVIRVGAEYHLACTGGDGGGQYVIRSSKDLVSWKATSHIFPTGTGPAWADGSFWAPEIHKVGDEFVAYFSAHEKGKTLAIGAAKSKSVLGPFADIGQPLVRAAVGAIDVSQFQDDKSVPYLVWKDDGNSQGKPTPIHGQRLNADGTVLVGAPVTLITNDLAWEGGLVEAPWVVRRDGWYYLFYSANAYYDGRYAIGVARSTSPLGPYEKQPLPIVKTNSRWVGPGHCSVVETPDGKTMMIYHAWRAGQVNTPGSGRVVLVDEIFWRDGWPEVPAGPSFASMPIPLARLCRVRHQLPMSDHPPHSLPGELLAALSAPGEPFSVRWHHRVLSGLESLGGETHLVGTSRGVRLFSRGSMLLPFVEVSRIKRLHVARSPLRTELAVDHEDGTHRVPLGYREAHEIEVLLGAAAAEAGTPPASDDSPREPDAIALAALASTGLPDLTTDLAAFEHTEVATETTSLPPDDVPRAAHAGPRPWFETLLGGTVPRTARQALLEARAELDRDRPEAALVVLRDSARHPRWHVRVALAELLLSRGQAKEALLAMDEAEEAHAPPALLAPLREAAARSLGNRRQLLRSLRHRRDLLSEGPEQELVGEEIRALEGEIAKAKEERHHREAESQEGESSRKRARAAEKRADRASRPARPSLPDRPKKVKRAVDPTLVTLEPPGLRALRPAIAKSIPPRPGAAAKTTAMSVPSLWVLALVFTASVIFVIWQLNRGPGSAPFANPESGPRNVGPPLARAPLGKPRMRSTAANTCCASGSLLPMAESTSGTPSTSIAAVNSASPARSDERAPTRAPESDRSVPTMASSSASMSPAPARATPSMLESAMPRRELRSAVAARRRAMASTGISLRDSRRSLTVGGGLVARRFILYASPATSRRANSCARSPPIHREVGIVDTMHLRASIFVVLASVAAGCGTAGTLPDGASSAAGRAGAAGAGARGGTTAQAGGAANGDAGGSTTSAGNAGAPPGNGGAAGKLPAAGGSGKGGVAGTSNEQGGAAGETAQGGNDSGGGAAGDGGGEAAGAGGDDGSAGAGGEPATDPCPDESKLVYVLTDDRQLYRFDPPVLTFTKVGKLDCKNSSSAYSMAVSRSGIAYAVLDDGSLQSIDVKTAKCTATTFKPNQQGFSMFGMGFTSKDAADETLYVSDEAGKNLGKIDTTTFVLTKVGTFDKFGSARSELTGNSAGELFGAFEGSPYNVAQIDPATAKILSTVPQKPVTKSSGGSNFAFASWGGKFFLFVGPGSSTDVFVYDPIAKTTVKKKSVSQVIVGAGVSTCAPRTSQQ